MGLQPPEDLVDFVARVGGQLAPSHDRREYTRFYFAVPIRVQPLDDFFRPTGVSFAAVTRDLSAAGIGVLYTKPVKSKYIEITVDFPPDHKILTVEVLRCKPIGSFYDIGGRFVNREVERKNVSPFGSKLP